MRLRVVFLQMGICSSEGVASFEEACLDSSLSQHAALPSARYCERSLKFYFQTRDEFPQQQQQQQQQQRPYYRAGSV